MDVVVFFTVVAVVGGIVAYMKVPAFKAKVDGLFKRGE